MNSKELRINFPDYTAEQQEADARKKPVKEIYITRVSGVWHGFIPRKRYSVTITADKGIELPEFVKEVKAEYPDYKMRCVRNYGIDKHLENNFAKLEQMKRFNEGR